MKRSTLLIIGAGVAGGLLLCAVLLYQIPSIKSRVNWRVERIVTYVRGMAEPAGNLPTPVEVAAVLPPPKVSVNKLPTPTPPASPTPCAGSDCTAAAPTLSPPSPTPTVTPTLPPFPPQASIPAPAYEKQDQNNCGPASLAMYLRTYNWKGTQYDISDVIKPDLTDRNVNIDELVYFVRTHAGWLNADYRVGGDLDLLKRFIANGMGIMIEETSWLDKAYWPGDDLWAGHYLLLTAYDEAKHEFTSQDTWLGANLRVDYQVLDKRWQAFNRAYILIYRPDQQDTVQAILRENWDEIANRQNALKTAQDETVSDPKNPFPWFNTGTNLLYFERYSEAAQAFDEARRIGLPQRMLRYQFGPFIAYFRTNRIEDLKTLTDYALKVTPNSEEDLLWNGWAIYMQGKKADAINQFKAALKVNPFYSDAKYALNYLGGN